jgi:hypothetical protein
MKAQVISVFFSTFCRMHRRPLVVPQLAAKRPLLTTTHALQPSSTATRRLNRKHAPLSGDETNE